MKNGWTREAEDRRGGHRRFRRLTLTMADVTNDSTRRLVSKKQTLDDAYAAPANFLEIDVVNPITHGVGNKRYTDYEVRMRPISDLPDRRTSHDRSRSHRRTSLADRHPSLADHYASQAYHHASLNDHHASIADHTTDKPFHWFITLSMAV
ncbi:putative sorting nexin-12 isoform X2 [Penaeus vannamei]|uniref:Putative sorting nexin-12 isoform X2 n=1 Tax=Penaeus vannamei TaxID=6689 RepID=A0A3R7MKT9_PENVA|nr:putative sorting nexin-12 isoform X2 [Penaeus vannamei]